MLFIRISCNNPYGLVSLVGPLHPLPGPGHNVIYSVSRGKKCTLFLLQSLHCCWHTRRQKWPLCPSCTKAILNVVWWRTRDLYTVAHKRKMTLGEKSAFVLPWKGQYSLLMQVSANSGPSALETKLHGSHHAKDVWTSISGLLREGLSRVGWGE